MRQGTETGQTKTIKKTRQALLYKRFGAPEPEIPGKDARRSTNPAAIGASAEGGVAPEWELDGPAWSNQSSAWTRNAGQRLLSSSIIASMHLFQTAVSRPEALQSPRHWGDSLFPSRGGAFQPPVRIVLPHSKPRVNQLPIAGFTITGSWYGRLAFAFGVALALWGRHIVQFIIRL